MQLIPSKHIVIPEYRQRREFDEGSLMELEESIIKFGLLHPIVVRKEGDIWKLVAGERRLRAMRSLFEEGRAIPYGGGSIGVGLVPCTLIGDLSPLQYEEAELEENVRRTDLTWQELAAARARLHELRKQRNPAQTLEQTGEEIFGREGVTEPVAQAIAIAAHLGDTEVRKAASAKEAMRIIERKVRNAENARLAETAAKLESPHVLHVGDAAFAPIPADFDVIVTDPPYGMNADQFGDSAGNAVSEHTYKDDAATFLDTVVPALRRTLVHTRANAHAYIFCDLEWFFHLRDVLKKDGWQPFRTPLVWKRNTGRVPIPDYGPRRQYELILFARRGDRKVNYIAPDVLEFPTDDNLGMSAQKPVALFEELIKRSARPGDWIADPFCGTGPIFPAAHAQRCRAWGCEMTPSTAGIAAGRIKELTHV